MWYIKREKNIRQYLSIFEGWRKAPTIKVRFRENPSKRWFRESSRKKWFAELKRFQTQKEADRFMVDKLRYKKSISTNMILTT